MGGAPWRFFACEEQHAMRGVIRARVRGGSSLDVNDMKGATRAHRGAARDLRPDAELAIARAAMHRAARGRQRGIWKPSRISRRSRVRREWARWAEPLVARAPLFAPVVSTYEPQALVFIYRSPTVKSAFDLQGGSRPNAEPGVQ